MLVGKQHLISYYHINHIKRKLLKIVQVLIAEL